MSAAPPTGNAPGLSARFAKLVLRRVLRAFPLGVRRNLRAVRVERLVRSGRFASEEPEYGRLAEWLGEGDFALDVGANFGSYSLRMAELVGDTGRVYSFEPVPQTFAMLVRSIAVRGCRNVTALNLSCANENRILTMSIPDDPLAGEDLYQASISDTGPSLTSVVGIRIDDLGLPFDRLRLVKIDAEGHDSEVIKGMWGLIERTRPVLIVEHPAEAISAKLAALGYTLELPPRSPNGIFHPPDAGSR